MTVPVEILYVEDNANDVELTLRTLRKHRIANQVHVARDGQEALDFLFGESSGEGEALRHHPRLILLDLKLPKVDGLQVLRRLKGDPRTRRIPVVMLTSSSEERDKVESYELGVNSYIIKPVEFEELARTVEQLSLYWVILNQRPSGEG